MYDGIGLFAYETKIVDLGMLLNDANKQISSRKNMLFKTIESMHICGENTNIQA